MGSNMVDCVQETSNIDNSGVCYLNIYIETLILWILEALSHIAASKLLQCHV